MSVLEALAALSPPRLTSNLREAHAARAIRSARTCYDHLAGLLGVCITEALVDDGSIVLEDRVYRVTDDGIERFSAIGVDVNKVAEVARRTRRPLARACLDWSERRYHLAGALGAALCDRLIELEWLERIRSTRALRITNLGRRALRRRLGVSLY